MNMQLVYMLIAILTLAIVALLVFVVRGKRQGRRLSPLTGLTFGFILAGILFGSERVIGYGLLGVGLVLAVIELFISMRKQNDNT